MLQQYRFIGCLGVGLLLALTATAVEKPLGTFASAGASNNPADGNSIYGDAQLRGVLVRATWDAIEPTPGNFTFTTLAGQISNLKSKGLAWSLAILGGGIGSPAWLTNSPGQGGLGAPYVNYSFRGTPGYKLPLFWNTLVQTRLQLLANALAAQYGNDPSLKLVYVTQMTANGIEGHLQGVNMSDLVAAGYTDANWIAAGKQAARNFANAFTEKALAFEVHNVNGSAVVPGTIINDLWADTSLDHRVGAAMWWISGRTNYQSDLLAVLMDYPGDIYGQVIANSGTASEFPNGDYTAVFSQAMELGLRYIEPWDYEFANTNNSARRAWDATFAAFNSWADETFRLPPSTGVPAITLQPASQSANTGDTVTFGVAASGTTPLGYQWKFGGALISGSTNQNLVLGNIQTENAGSYTVTITNAQGSVTSDAALLTVIVAPGGAIITITVE